MLALGDTQVFGANTVNAFRFTWANTKTRANDPPEQFFSAADLGIPNIYTYVPGTTTVFVGATGQDLRFSGNHTVAAKIDSRIYQFSEDFSYVRNRHQFSVGTNVQHLYFDGWDYAGSNGTFTFNGTITGLALADFLTGQMSNFGHGSPNVNTNHQWVPGRLRPGCLAHRQQGHAQPGSPVGSVLRHGVEERHHLELLDRQLPRRHPQHQLPERAGRSALSR